MFSYVLPNWINVLTLNTIADTALILECLLVQHGEDEHAGADARGGQAELDGGATLGAVLRHDDHRRQRAQAQAHARSQREA